jgi:hypothetical protein
MTTYLRLDENMAATFKTAFSDIEWSAIDKSIGALEDVTSGIPFPSELKPKLTIASEALISLMADPQRMDRLSKAVVQMTIDELEKKGTKEKNPEEYEGWVKGYTPDFAAGLIRQWIGIFFEIKPEPPSRSRSTP